MEKKLQLIRHLYGEADDRTELRQLLDEPELNEEYQALSEAKFWLDHSKRERPAPEVLQRIESMALQPAAPEGRVGSSTRFSPQRQDRAAHPRKRGRRFVGAASLVLATLITAVVGYQWMATNALVPAFEDKEQPAALSADAESMPGSANRAFADSDLSERREDAAGRAMPAPQEVADEALRKSSTSQPALASSGASSFEADTVMPDWDKIDDLMRYKQRIDMLVEQNEDLTWDQAVVPLESFPSNSPRLQQLRQAGSRRPPGNTP